MAARGLNEQVVKLHVLLKDTVGLETGHARLAGQPASCQGDCLAPRSFGEPQMLSLPTGWDRPAKHCKPGPTMTTSVCSIPLPPFFDGFLQRSQKGGMCNGPAPMLSLLSISQALNQEQCQMAGWPHTWQGVESLWSCCLSSMGSRLEVLCFETASFP